MSQLPFPGGLWDNVNDASKLPPPQPEVESALMCLLERATNSLQDAHRNGAPVIPWACPVLAFGDWATADVATLGINPSDKEFVDSKKRELNPPLTRFPTLTSLKLSSWSQAKPEDLRKILLSYRNYFFGNPYDTWFRVLDDILRPAGRSYYTREAPACHLDLTPFATQEKWSAVSTNAKSNLLELGTSILGELLRVLPIRALILNGRTIISHLREISDVSFTVTEIPAWNLRRNTESPVRGLSYLGRLTRINELHLKREILILGFNHNLQSSYGVTGAVKCSIGEWIRSKVQCELS